MSQVEPKIDDVQISLTETKEQADQSPQWYSQPYVDLLERTLQDPLTIQRVLDYELHLPPKYYEEEYLPFVPLRVLSEFIKTYAQRSLGSIYTNKVSKYVEIIVDTCPENVTLINQLLNDLMDITDRDLR